MAPSSLSPLSENTRPAMRRSAADSPAKAVDQDAHLRLQQDYAQAKKQGRLDRERLQELTAHLARVEEAAKRCMVRADPSAKGGVAARLLAAEAQLARLGPALAAAEGKLAQERRAAGEQRQRAEALKARLQTVLRDQRRLVVQVGHAESTTLSRKLYGGAAPPGLPQSGSEDGASEGAEEEGRDGLHEQLLAALGRVEGLTQHLTDARDALSTLRAAHCTALQDLRDREAEVASLKGAAKHQGERGVGAPNPVG